MILPARIRFTKISIYHATHAYNNNLSFFLKKATKKFRPPAFLPQAASLFPPDQAAHPVHRIARQNFS
jgi:hypothetical protein